MDPIGAAIGKQVGMVWIHADEAKAGKAIAVPLSEAGVQVLNAQAGKNAEYCFACRGQPIRQVGTKAWRAAEVLLQNRYR